MQENNFPDNFTQTTETVEFCPICESPDSLFMLQSHDRLHLLPGEFNLVRCLNCTLVRLTPRPIPEELWFYYPQEDYYSYQIPEGSVEKVTARGSLITTIRDGIRNSVLNRLDYPTAPLKFWQKILQPLFWAFLRNPALYDKADLFPKYVPNGTALDIGCGNGIFLNYLKHHNWQVSGVELSETAAQVAKKAHNIDIFVGQVEDAPFAPGSFDFIRMSHIIEHLPHLKDSMSHIISLLKPGGVLYIETPNIDCFEFKFCGKYWFPLETPRHLFMFSPKTLTVFLNSLGMDVDSMKTFFFSFYDWEDTYRVEAETGEILPERPQIRLSSYPRIVFLTLFSRLKQLFNGTSGNLMRCWAVKK